MTRVQWKGDAISMLDVIDLVQCRVVPCNVFGKRVLEVQAPSGDLVLEVGDWITKDAEGKLTVSKAASE